MKTETATETAAPASFKKSRVFVLEITQNVDITAAFEYGGIVPLFKATSESESASNNKPSQWQTSKFMDEIVCRLEEHDYKPEIDFILIAGHMIPVVILVSAIIREWIDDTKYVQALFWSSKFKRYIARKL